MQISAASEIRKQTHSIVLYIREREDEKITRLLQESGFL